MALVTLEEILKRASKGKYGVGNFDIFNIEMLKGVMQAAEECNSPIILAYGEGFDDYIDMGSFAGLMVDIANKSDVPVAIHLDHAREFDSILKAMHYGFTSVMIDSSDAPFEENIRKTKEVVKAARALGVSVEAELGHVSGLENFYHSDDYIYTDVKEAKEFVKATGVDALAVAIGTVHGVYKEEPKLNVDRLKEIKEAVNIPLVLHGGSGLSEDDFRTVIKNGIEKVNIHTDLVIAAVQKIKDSINKSGISYMDIGLKSTEVVKQETIKKMNIFGSVNKNWL